MSQSTLTRLFFLRQPVRLTPTLLQIDKKPLDFTLAKVKGQPTVEPKKEQP